jgi:hypothetical protein
MEKYVRGSSRAMNHSVYEGGDRRVHIDWTPVVLVLIVVIIGAWHFGMLNQLFVLLVSLF